MGPTLVPVGIELAEEAHLPGLELVGVFAETLLEPIVHLFVPLPLGVAELLGAGVDFILGLLRRAGPLERVRVPLNTLTCLKLLPWLV